MLDIIRHASIAVVAAVAQIIAWLINFIAAPVTPEALSQIIQLTSESLSLAVILIAAIYHLYHYFVETETDIRQDQIDAVLKQLAEEELDRQKRGKQVTEENATHGHSESNQESG